MKKKIIWYINNDFAIKSLTKTVMLRSSMKNIYDKNYKKIHRPKRGSTTEIMKFLRFYFEQQQLLLLYSSKQSNAKLSNSKDYINAIGISENGPNLDLLCVRQSDAAPFCENYAKLYFDTKHVKNT